MLVGILVSCSHGRGNPTDMLAKVNFNKIAEEMDMRREEKRREKWSETSTVCGVCAQVHDFHVFFLHVMVVVPFDCSTTCHLVFCFSLQFLALCHMLSNVNMWTIA